MDTRGVLDMQNLSLGDKLQVILEVDIALVKILDGHQECFGCTNANSERPKRRFMDSYFVLFDRQTQADTHTRASFDRPYTAVLFYLSNE